MNLFRRNRIIICVPQIRPLNLYTDSRGLNWMFKRGSPTCPNRVGLLVIHEGGYMLGVCINPGLLVLAYHPYGNTIQPDTRHKPP